MAYSIAQIAQALGAEAYGEVDLIVTRAAEPAAAGPDDLALAMAPLYADDLRRGDAVAAVIWPGADWGSLGLRAAIVAPRARLALSRLTGLMKEEAGFAPGIDPMARIDPSARIGADVSIGPFTVIGAGAVIGAGSRIAAHVSIGQGVEIGASARLYPGVRLQPGTRIGAGFVAQPNVVIGGDGFSFVTEDLSNPEKAKAAGGVERLPSPGAAPWHKIESLGGVLIGDDVEIGANSTVDAGTIRPTRIGRGTKIDNLVQVGHNVIIGEDCLLCAQCGVAGSTVLGNRVVLGGQSGVGDHHRIGDDVVTGGGSVVLSNLAAGSVVLGYPAQRMDRALDAYKTLRRLGRRFTVPKPGKSD